MLPHAKHDLARQRDARARNSLKPKEGTRCATPEMKSVSFARGKAGRKFVQPGSAGICRAPAIPTVLVYQVKFKLPTAPEGGRESESERPGFCPAATSGCAATTLGPSHSSSMCWDGVNCKPPQPNSKRTMFFGVAQTGKSWTCDKHLCPAAAENHRICAQTFLPPKGSFLLNHMKCRFFL